MPFLLLSRMFLSKRILFSSCLMIWAVCGFAQGGVIPLHLNYDLSDKDIYGASYNHTAYRLNTKTDPLALGMLFQVCDTFPDRISGNFYSPAYLPALRLDSVRIKVNLSKHSLQNDTLILGLAGSYNGIFPGENNFYADSIVLASSFAPGRTYASAQYLTVPVGVYVPGSFSLWLGFRGQPNDTLNVWSGYGYAGVCAAQSPLERARLSHFFPNAFAYRKQFGQILPTLAGEDIFWECDTVPGFDTLTDGRNYIQNWDIDYFFTATTAGIPENVLAVSPLLFPNPGSGMFHLAGPCKRVTVFSLSGREVWRSVPNGQSVYLPLPAGLYAVRLETENGTRVEKLIITE